MAKITELCSYFQVLDDTKWTNISAALAKLVFAIWLLLFSGIFFSLIPGSHHLFWYRTTSFIWKKSILFNNFSHKETFFFWSSLLEFVLYHHLAKPRPRQLQLHLLICYEFYQYLCEYISFYRTGDIIPCSADHCIRTQFNRIMAFLSLAKQVALGLI